MIDALCGEGLVGMASFSHLTYGMARWSFVSQGYCTCRVGNFHKKELQVLV